MPSKLVQHGRRGWQIQTIEQISTLALPTATRETGFESRGLRSEWFAATMAGGHRLLMALITFAKSSVWTS